MAETDQDQKTEAPTGKRLNDAREQGQVPISQEIRTLVMLIGGMLIVLVAGPLLAREMKGALAIYFGSADQLSMGDGSAKKAIMATFWQLMPGLALTGAVLLVCAVAGTMLQTGLFMSTQLLELKWDRINPLTGWGKLFSLSSVVEFLKGMFKISIVGGIVFLVVKPIFKGLELLNGMEPALQIQVIRDSVLKVIYTVIAAFGFIAAADFIYQRFKFYRNLRMTKQEVKEEHKQLEGDPMIRARLRALRMERSRRRMMARVPEANVVITNPTHFAVALMYESGKMNAPIVVAKGQDMIAMKIREIAQENEVPLVENPPLARALFKACDLEEAIPVEHYQAVAEIIGYVYKLKARKG